MRLLLINGNTTQAITERCAAAARAVAGPDTDIVPLTANRGPKIINTRAENALASAAVIELLAEHAGSADAALIAISFDTALDGARETAPFPVVGMTEAALHAAALLGGPIGFIGPVRRALNVYRGVVERTGLASRIAGYRAVDMRPQDFADPANLVAPAAKLARELIEQDHADSIVVAGAALAGLIDRVQADVPVPVVDGIAAGVVLAEALVRLGRPKATAGSHAKLPDREVTGFGDAVSRMFSGKPTKR
jgi:allantoin racemase